MNYKTKIKKYIYQSTLTYTYHWVWANLSRVNRKNDDYGEKKINTELRELEN